MATRIRTGGNDIRDVNLRGSVWDYADLLRSVGRATLRSFVPGPWGPGDETLAQEMKRRVCTPPCDQQCFIAAHDTGGTTMRGCHCATSGWQYTADEDVQVLEKCPPRDVWNDARSILKNHIDVGRGSKDPILCDCDDMTIIVGAVGKFIEWERAGRPMARHGIPLDPPHGVEWWDVITKPKDSSMAHAFNLRSGSPPRVGAIKVGGLWVFDGARYWGMKPPQDDFYGTGDVAPFRLRFSDLVEEYES